MGRNKRTCSTWNLHSPITSGMLLGPLLDMSFVWRNQVLQRRDDASVPRTRASKRGRSAVEHVDTRSVLRVCPSKASKCSDGLLIWRSPSMSSAKSVDTSSPGLTISWCSGPSSGYILLKTPIASTSPRPLSDNLVPSASSIA